MRIVALTLFGCTGGGDSLQTLWHPSFSMYQVAPDGSVLEMVDHETRGLYFVENDRTKDVFIGNNELEHGEAPVSGDGCATATTLHVPYGFSLTFGPNGALLDAEHMFEFTAADQDTRSPDLRTLFGGRINVLENEGERISIELVDALVCPLDFWALCDPQDFVPQSGPYQLTIEGTFIVPMGNSELRSSNSLYTDPTSGQRLCEAFQPAIDGGYRE